MKTCSLKEVSLQLLLHPGTRSHERSHAAGIGLPLMDCNGVLLALPALPRSRRQACWCCFLPRETLCQYTRRTRGKRARQIRGDQWVGTVCSLVQAILTLSPLGGAGDTRPLFIGAPRVGRRLHLVTSFTGREGELRVGLLPRFTGVFCVWYSGMLLRWPEAAVVSNIELGAALMIRGLGIAVFRLVGKLMHAADTLVSRRTTMALD